MIYRILILVGTLVGVAFLLSGCQVDPLAFGEAFAKGMEESVSQMHMLSEEEKAKFLESLKEIATQKMQTAQTQPWQDTLTDFGFPVLVGIASMFGINLSRNRARALRGEPVGSMPRSQTGNSD